MNLNIVRKVLLTLVIVAACFFVLLPLFRPGFPVTDDGDWMVIRLSAFYQTLRDGQFPVRFLGRLNYSYGYPVANFLYPGFLYIGSFLHILGLTFQNVVKVIMGGSIIIGAVALYLWLRHFFDEISSTLGVLSFLFMPYISYDLYKRGSVGELLAIGVCLTALYIIENGYRWALPPIIALLIISHNTLALFFLTALFFYILLKRFWNLIGPFCLGIVMSAFFWIPVLIEQKIVLFNGVSVSNPAQYFVISRQLILVGAPFLITCLLAFITGKRNYKREQWFFVIILLGSTLLSAEITSAIWKLSSFDRVIQFPFRFFSLWVFAGPWFIAAISENSHHAKQWLLGLTAVLVLFFFVIPYQKSKSVVRPEGFYTTNEGTTTVANEYMPKWVSTTPLQRASNRIEVYQGNVSIEERHITTNTIDIIARTKEESTLQINTMYYPGWGAMVDNKQVVILYDNPLGLMHLILPAGDHTVYMAFRETAGRFAADCISLVAIAFYFISFFLFRFIKRKK
jgi:hypothetical protein